MTPGTINPGTTLRSNPVFYNRYLLAIAGLGGLLYGIDVGISSAALLYLSKTVDLTVSQTSIIVAAVFGGSTISSLIAGFFADWFGRKKMVVPQRPALRRQRPPSSSSRTASFLC